MRTDSSTRACSRSTRPALTWVPPRSSCDGAAHGTNAFTTLQPGPRVRRRRYRPTAAGTTIVSAYDERVHVAALGLDLDLLARHEVEDVDASVRVVLDRVREVEPVDGEEELRMPAELELRPPVPSADDAGLGHELGDRVAASSRVEVGERVAHVHRPELAVEVAP